MLDSLERRAGKLRSPSKEVDRHKQGIAIATAGKHSPLAVNTGPKQCGGDFRPRNHASGWCRAHLANLNGKIAVSRADQPKAQSAFEKLSLAIKTERKSIRDIAARRLLNIGRQSGTPEAFSIPVAVVYPRKVRVDYRLAEHAQRGRVIASPFTQVINTHLPLASSLLSKLEVLRMGFIIKPKIKAELHRKSKSAKKHHEQEVSLAEVTSNTSTELLLAMKLERRPLSSLKGLKRSVRKSEVEQIEQVCRSIKNLKQSAPILINEDGEIPNGHIVAEALRRLGSPEA